MKAAPAFTFVEMLVVILILGLMVGVTALSAPQMFDRGALRQASARLETDLADAARRARSEASFASIAPIENGSAYEIALSDRPMVRRQLPGRVRILVSPDP